MIQRFTSTASRKPPAEPDTTDRPRPAHHADDTATAFKNPWVESKGLIASYQVLLSRFPFEWARRLHGHPAKPVKVVKPDFGVGRSAGEGRRSVKATWLGHCGFMVELPSMFVRVLEKKYQPTRIIFDPIWSDRASPSQWAGPRRRLPPPCDLADLPEFHFVVISHNHYDHLDWPTIEKIHLLRGSDVHYVVPLGNKKWMVSGGISADQVTELDWWDEVQLPRRSRAGFRDSPTTKFVCTPAQHTSGRGVYDQATTLWASWVVEETVNGVRAAVYHAGDTGYMTENGPNPVFKEIGEKHGPFDLAMLPIWRGASLSFVASLGLRLANHAVLDGLHASPAHALALHQDIRSRHSLAAHFATFAGSDVEGFEPVVELVDARDRLAKEVQVQAGADEDATQGEGGEDGGGDVLPDADVDSLDGDAQQLREGKRVVGEWWEEGGFGWIDVGETALIPVGVAQT